MTAQTDAISQKDLPEERPGGNLSWPFLGLVGALVIVLAISTITNTLNVTQPDISDIEQPSDTGGSFNVAPALRELIESTPEPEPEPAPPEPEPEIQSEILTLDQILAGTSPQSDILSNLNLTDQIPLRTDGELAEVRAALNADMNQNIALLELPSQDREGLPQPAPTARPSTASSIAELENTIAQMEQMVAEASAPGFGEEDALAQLAILGGNTPPPAPEPAAEPARQRYNLAPSTLISATLDSNISSDTPTTVSATVHHPVLNRSGDAILIPIGSRLLGVSGPYQGANEILAKSLSIQFTSLVLPDGELVNIGALSARSRDGFPGVSGRTSNNFVPRTLGAFAFAVLSIGPSLTFRSGEPQSSVDQATADATSQIGQQFTPLAQRYSSIVPTTIVRAGTSINIVTQVPLLLPESPIGSRLIDFGGF